MFDEFLLIPSDSDECDGCHFRESSGDCLAGGACIVLRGTHNRYLNTDIQFIELLEVINV